VDEKNKSLYYTLSQRVPSITKDFLLIFPVENRVQKQQVEEISLDLLSFLREKLNNYSINLKLEHTVVPKKKILYSAEERYKYLAEKYPAIEELRKRLDLDIDY
jgi:DNA polymerase-3 subunit gamma/tau